MLTYRTAAVPADPQGVRISEAIYVDGDDNIVSESDPRVHRQLYGAGAVVPFREAERLGLARPDQDATPGRETKGAGDGNTAKPDNPRATGDGGEDGDGEDAEGAPEGGAALPATVETESGSTASRAALSVGGEVNTGATGSAHSAANVPPATPASETGKPAGTPGKGNAKK